MVRSPLHAKLAKQRTEAGWREVPPPVHVDNMPLTDSDWDEDGMSTRGLIACLVGNDRVSNDRVARGRSVTTL